MSNRALDPNEIAQLQALKDNPRTRTSRVPGTEKTVKLNLDLRTIENWFKLEHVLGKECDVPQHDEDNSVRGRATVEIGTYHVCRHCFLASMDQNVGA